MAKKTEVGNPRKGITLGFLSYTLYTTFLIFSGLDRKGIDDILPLTAFAIGGSVGVKVWDKIRISVKH